ncbi:unnamed protein product [Lota lota]
MAQALTNVLLMDAVAGCLHSQRSIGSASKLAYFDKIKHEVSMMVPETTSQTLKHKINPSQDLAEPQTVHVLLYTPGQLSSSNTEGEGNPKLWVALSGGRVVVFDAASWSMLQDCIQVGNAQLHSSALVLLYSASSCEGTTLLWDSFSLKVKRQLQLTCDRLSSIQIHNGMLWCCCGDSIVEVRRNGALQRRISIPDDLLSMPSRFNSFVLIMEIWVGCRSDGALGGLCSGQLRSQVLVVDPGSLAVQKELQAHSDTIHTLCSAEDCYVLSGSGHHDGKIAIWKV